MGIPTYSTSTCSARNAAQTVFMMELLVCKAAAPRRTQLALHVLRFEQPDAIAPQHLEPLFSHRFIRIGSLEMDPLSIAAAVVGLLAATGQVYGLLEAISSARNSPSTIESARVEIRHTEIALRSLQGLLERLETTESRRRRLVQIDDLRITFSDAILEFAAFESFLEPLSGLVARHSVISWSRHAKKIEEHLARIGRYKTSLMVILSILQWYVPCRPAGKTELRQGHRGNYADGTQRNGRRSGSKPAEAAPSGRNSLGRECRIATEAASIRRLFRCSQHCDATPPPPCRGL